MMPEMDEAETTTRIRRACVYHFVGMDTASCFFTAANLSVLQIQFHISGFDPSLISHKL